MKRFWIPILAIFVSALLTTPVYASSVHLKGGANTKPTFFDNGLTLIASGELAGLGFGNVLVKDTATANPTATCTNPSGANQPPGHNPAKVTVTGSTEIPASQIKNGNTPFSVETDPPTTPIPGAPDCPGTSTNRKRCRSRGKRQLHPHPIAECTRTIT